MKQHITSEQLAELTEGQKDRLFEWELVSTQKKLNKDLPGAIYVQWRNDKNLPLISIGQMIEFLEDNGNAWWSIRKEEINVFIGELPDGYEGHYSVYMDEKTTGNTLCDALWEAVKEVLEAK